MELIVITTDATACQIHVGQTVDVENTFKTQVPIFSTNCSKLKTIENLIFFFFLIRRLKKINSVLNVTCKLIDYISLC